MGKTSFLLLAIDLAGGQTALAEKLTDQALNSGLLPKGKKVSQQSVSNWVLRHKQSPSKYAALIAAIVNQKVTANQLRPDLYPHDTSV
jgi:DNA-binding transcriptional regulator YdaS (Cro superfamily)